MERPLGLGLGNVVAVFPAELCTLPSPYLKRLEDWAVTAAALVTIIGFPLLLVSLWFAYRVDTVISEQLGEIKSAQSEDGIAAPSGNARRG